MNLFEGRYDQISGILVDAIWVVIKKSKKIYDETGSELYATQTQKTTNFKFQIIIRREEDFGAYKLDANTYNNKMVFSLTIDPDIEPDYYSEINVELQGTVRHELEHLLQEKGVPEKAKFPSKYMLNKINHNDFNYLMADHETEAMVKGFYRQAKTQKEKLDVVMDDFLSYFVKDGGITKKQSKEIKIKWLTYAKKHLPAALYKKINEAHNFERGIDPKRAMTTGAAANPINIDRIAYYLTQSMWTDKLRQPMSKVITHMIFKDLDNGYMKNYSVFGKPDTFVYYGDEGDSFSTVERVYKFKEIKGRYIKYDGILYKISDDLKEAQHFQRGLDPKIAMGTGLSKYSIKRVLLKNPTIDTEGVWYWLMELNPSIGKALGITNREDLKSVYSFDTDWYCEEEEDLDSDELDDDFISDGTSWSTKNGLSYRLGKTKLDGAKVLHFSSSGASGYVSKAKWLGLNEAQNFQRGLDPKVAMNTGDLVERAKQDIHTAIIKLAEKYSSYDNDSMCETHTDAILKFGFYKTYGLETWQFWIGYRKIKDSFDKRRWFTGWTKVNETWQNRHPIDGQPERNFMDHFSNLDECIQKLESKLDNTWLIKETHNFTRGLDPKVAMGTGDITIRERKTALIDSITDCDPGHVWDIDDSRYYPFVQWDGVTPDWLESALEDAEYVILKSLYLKLRIIQDEINQEADYEDKLNRQIDEFS